ncbi:ORF83 [Ranid herpesvirus 1]|uniref:ORF83 n=1 Tax=Ranid herpesvirus 1 TaxID=85655 RepID=Q9YQY5_9VIRU|nr:ORF83 [Ranid herpesvirus 1]AAD12280.1 ORF83 [Ranid herpesvirus 1]
MASYESVSAVLPDELQNVRDMDKVGYLCNVRAETVKVTRAKMYVLLSLSFFIFTVFVGTDGAISFIHAAYGNDTMAANDSVYVLYVITTLWVVVTLVFNIVIFAYSFLYIHRARVRMNRVHRMFRHGYIFAILFLVALIFYVLCGVRAIVLTYCEFDAHRFSPMCLSVLRYTGSVNMIFIAAYFVTIVWCMTMIRYTLIVKLDNLQRPPAEHPYTDAHEPLLHNYSLAASVGGTPGPV